MDVLVLGYGNPAREDDALGPRVAEGIGGLAIPGVETDADYQLTVEDAERFGRADAVVLVDAAAAGPAPFRLRPVATGGGGKGFSTHALTAEGVTDLARELFGSRAPVYVLGVRGYRFRMFRERMTLRARVNARRAVRYLAGVLRSGRLRDGGTM